MNADLIEIKDILSSRFFETNSVELFRKKDILRIIELCTIYKLYAYGILTYSVDCDGRFFWHWEYAYSFQNQTPESILKSIMGLPDKYLFELEGRVETIEFIEDNYFNL